jgi:hypothetical protein
MPIPPAVQGYTGLTQQARLVLENASFPPGEQLLLGQTNGAATMSLTTQPSNFSPTTGMHLHFFVIGNTTAGTIGIVGTNATGGAQTSQTYHVAAAPQNAQGYTEFTTKEVWQSVTASSITLTTLTPCQIIVFGSYAGKYLIPTTADAEEKIGHHAPPDKRGILFKNLRVVQLTKGVDVGKFDSDLYPDSLWAYYMAIGNTPVITTVPSVATTKLAATTKAATMTLTTGPAAPGEFLIFTVANSNVLAGTIVLQGLDQYGNPATETITIPATNGTFYSRLRYSSLTTPGSNQFTTTGLTATATIAVTGVFAWTYTWVYDGITNVTPYSGGLELFDGVQGVVVPGLVLSDLTLDWQKEKEILLQSKGLAQDFCIVGDPNPSGGSFTGIAGVNPFNTLVQPASLPVVSWPASFYIDTGSGTPFTTQDGSMETYKLAITTGRKWVYTGDGMQRGAFVTWDVPPDFALDAEIVYQNYAYYVGYFKQNTPLILASTFQGNLLGSAGSSVFYEQVQVTLPAKVDTFKIDRSKNPVAGTLKLMAQYDFSNLGYAYKVAVTAQQPPNYTS